MKNLIILLTIGFLISCSPKKQTFVIIEKETVEMQKGFALYSYFDKLSDPQDTVKFIDNDDKYSVGDSVKFK